MLIGKKRNCIVKALTVHKYHDIVIVRHVTCKTVIFATCKTITFVTCKTVIYVKLNTIIFVTRSQYSHPGEHSLCSLTLAYHNNLCI